MPNFEHVITTGQSLSVGSQGVPNVSSAPEAANAYRVGTSGAIVAHDLAAGLNQRPDISMGYRIAQSDSTTDYGFSTHGLSNTSITNLSKGGTSGKYEEAIQAVTATRNTVVGRGDTYRVRAVHWIQGEADQSLATTRTEYVTSLHKLRDDYATDIKGITGQTWTPPLIMSQPSTWNAGSNPPKINLALLDAHRQSDGFYVVGAQYQLPYADNLHLTAPGYYYLGEYHARAHKSVLSTGVWNPVMPVSATASGQKLVVKFHVPTPPLTIDTTLVAAQPNYGFSLHGTSATITGVAVTGPDEVTITTSGALDEGAQVGYGATEQGDTNKSLGNIRDSEPAVSKYDSTPLPNWSVQFLDPITVLEGPTWAGKAFRGNSMYLVGASGLLYSLSI